MLKLMTLLKKSGILLGLTATLIPLTPSKAMSQSSINPLEEEWIKLSCEGEPSMTLAPDKQEMIHRA